jgi:predicted nucleic acid-binding protein
LLKKLLEEDAIVAWWTTQIEVYSALARRRREGGLSRAEEDQGRGIVMRLADEWTEIVPGVRLREHAARLLLIHPLRAADSLQLAAALVWSNGHAIAYSFVCLDQRLREAASQEGFRLLPPQC